MKRVVIIEDEVQYCGPIETLCRENGFLSILIITPRYDDTADKIVSQIVRFDPELILLDHDLCRCSRYPCGCVNGQDIFDRLDSLQSKVLSISGANRDYIPRDRIFSYKDCLDEMSVRNDFKARLQWMFEKA